MEKLIIGHLVAAGVPISQGTAATDLGIETTGEKKMRIKPMETHMERQAKSEESPSSVPDEPGYARALMDGHSSCSSLWSHGTGSLNNRRGQHDVQKFENGYSDGHNSRLPYFHGCLVRNKAGAACGNQS